MIIDFLLIHHLFGEFGIIIAAVFKDLITFLVIVLIFVLAFSFQICVVYTQIEGAKYVKIHRETTNKQNSTNSILMETIVKNLSLAEYESGSGSNNFDITDSIIVIGSGSGSESGSGSDESVVFSNEEEEFLHMPERNEQIYTNTLFVPTEYSNTYDAKNNTSNKTTKLFYKDKWEFGRCGPNFDWKSQLNVSEVTPEVAEPDREEKTIIDSEEEIAPRNNKFGLSNY